MSSGAGRRRLRSHERRSTIIVIRGLRSPTAYSCSRDGKASKDTMKPSSVPAPKDRLTGYTAIVSRERACRDPVAAVSADPEISSTTRNHCRQTRCSPQVYPPPRRLRFAAPGQTRFQLQSGLFLKELNSKQTFHIGKDIRFVLRNDDGENLKAMRYSAIRHQG